MPIKKESIATAEHYTWGNNCDGWHLFKSERLNVIRERMPAGASEQLHYHERAQQVFYILSGVATFELNAETIVVSAGESLHIPQGVRHFVKNNEKEFLEFLLISEPRVQNDRINL